MTKLKVKPTSASNILLLSIFGFFVLFILWASLAELDEVTRATGRVVPSKQIQVIQNLEGGIIKEILVKQGDSVKAGDVLVRLDRTQFDADFNRNEEEFMMLKSSLIRLTAESQFEVPEFEPSFTEKYPTLVINEQNLYHARRAEFEASISSLSARLKQIEQSAIEAEISLISARSAEKTTAAEVEMLKPLVEKGIEPRLELIRAEQRLIQAEGDHKIAALNVGKAAKSVEEVNLQIEAARQKFRASALTELNDAQNQINKLLDALPALSDKVDRTNVIASTDGTINRVLVSTVGGVIKPGMPIVELVPLDDTLLIEAEVQPSDIAFLRPGQPARVKLTAYDYSRYGSLDAEVENISPDAIMNEQKQNVYIIKIRTTENSLMTGEGDFPILPGMVAEVDILNGKKSIMRYLMNPVLKLKDNAFRER
ncbi:HlyD family type I secretion periplasmic adaptor subunit [Paremcibacter congregatus]|uniref:Membrane fusion protein (MFP) family protein n=1 Tax=Paremcibacter congregatus TaxID=2043170 RepID=A0A2G4YVC2_9PROT|nr:HlyD family type I secretion periplasmic adaptor subunit [Paremcibacter congregatus]PHZ86278.1 hemolysin secretion protein D [Paremcibacter congregatus]QDE27245.1 HlyD family type I secretion periplasmic adaptor subunit [Paremcibacter congregatus]